MAQLTQKLKSSDLVSGGIVLSTLSTLAEIIVGITRARGLNNEISPQKVALLTQTSAEKG
jgi:hypothetical protein